MIIYFGKQIFSRFVFTTVSIHVINIKVFCRRRIYQFGVPFVALATIFFLGLTLTTSRRSRSTSQGHNFYAYTLQETGVGKSPVRRNTVFRDRRICLAGQVTFKSYLPSEQLVQTTHLLTKSVTKGSKKWPWANEM